MIVSFYDGHKYSTETSAAQLLAGVEVVFEDSTTQLFANPTSLREVTEIERAPHGPPLWSERAVIPSVGHAVAVYDIDTSVLAVALAREFRVQYNTPLGFDQARSLLQSLFPPSMGLDPTNISLALESVGYQPTDEVLLSAFTARLYKQQERFYPLSDRFLIGNTAPILSLIHI